MIDFDTPTFNKKKKSEKTHFRKCFILTNLHFFSPKNFYSYTYTFSVLKFENKGDIQICF